MNGDVWFFVFCLYLAIIGSVLYHVVVPLSIAAELWAYDLEERLHLRLSCPLSAWVGLSIFFLWIAFDIWLYRLMF